jgi:predicted metal-binding membrane protein
MIYDAREFARVRNPMLMISAIAWGLILIDSGGMLVSVHGAARHATHAAHFTHAEAAPLSASLQMLTTNLAPLAAGWMLMLAAMMTPALIPPVRHIRLRTFTRRRTRAIALFATAYAAIWIAVGAVLIALALAFNLLAPQSYLPAAAVILVAFAWQCSPVKQRCLNRCHGHTELAAFGAAADIGVLRFGATHGIWCASACWALMLVPMLLPQGHVIAMAAATVLIVSERLELPRPPCWRVRGAGKALRIVIAQARIRLSFIMAESSTSTEVT